MPLEIIPVVIHEGESLSDPIDCTNGRIVKLTMPHDWTSAIISFQTSSDNAGYNNIYHPDGREVQCVVNPGGAIIGVDLIAGWVKIRSGTSGQPVPQPERREFAVAIDVVGAVMGGRTK